MSYEEALEWLKGTRSLCNSMNDTNMDIRQINTAHADAAMVQHAYWVVKAHKEGLI